MSNTLGTKTHDVTHFIEKFEAIPADEWAVEAFYRPAGSGKRRCCALGHCGVRHQIEECHVEACALESIFADAFGVWTPSINDGDVDRFPQNSPKNRVLSALYILRSRGW